MSGSPVLPAAVLLGIAMASAGAGAQASVVVLPAGTRVELRLESPIDTRRARSGDVLAFRAEGSDCVDGRRLVGGALMAGRVVHAQKAGMFGKAAELLVSAGPWTPEGSTPVVRLRNLRAQAGRSRDAAAIGVAVVAGPFAAFVRGGNIVLPAGTPMAADTRDTVELPATAFEACDKVPPRAEATPNPNDPPVHHEPLQGELHEAHDVRPVDPGREPRPEPGRGAGTPDH